MASARGQKPIKRAFAAGDCGAGDGLRGAFPDRGLSCTPQGSAFPEWRYMYFRISADRFLRNMVRAVVGTLLEVGRGKRSVDDFASLILDAGHAPLPGQGRPSLRGLAGDSVPGHALFFSGAEYGGPHPANR